jgi:uncharacterized phiE125 gp8 family phage protein
MPAILTTPPAVEPVTLAETKGHLRVSHADEDDAITRMILSARRHLELQTGLCFITQTWSCFRDAWPEAGDVKLPVAPVMSLGDVKVYGEDDIAAVIDPAHYFLDGVSRPARLVLRNSRIWPPPGRQANGIEIAVTAGYGATASAVPQPLREALLQLVAHWYGHRGDETVRLPLQIDAIIADFREVRL